MFAVVADYEQAFSGCHADVDRARKVIDNRDSQTAVEQDDFDTDLFLPAQNNNWIRLYIWHYLTKYWVLYLEMHE